MYAQRQGIEVQNAIPRDDNLTVQDTSLRQLLEQRFAQFWEVAIKRLAIAALDEQIFAIAEYDRAKAIPFRLESP
jgi:hypothetical protein